LEKVQKIFEQVCDGTGLFLEEDGVAGFISAGSLLTRWLGQ
jgi:hypothetical protein